MGIAVDHKYLELALAESKQVFVEGTYPIGAVLVGPDGELMEVFGVEVPNLILNIWNKFDGFPMEPLTKAWLYHHPSGARQRTVAEMAEHRREHGTSGNCFDLAIWLLHEFQLAGIRAHAIGHDFFTPKAHVAVIAYEGEQRYLCDLGDQWVSPIPVDCPEEEVVDPVPGFFPAAKVQIMTTVSNCTVTYHRPSGKISSQSYSLLEIEYGDLLRAGQHSQRLLRKPLCEMRMPFGGEIAHWEFCDGSSFLSTSTCLHNEPPATSTEEWCDRIHAHAGISRQVIAQSLDVYSRL